MSERTGYAEWHREEYRPEHRPGLENLPEIEDRLREKAGENAAIWPGDEELRDTGKMNFQDEARTWWRENGASLGAVESDLRMHQHSECLEARLKEAGRMGSAFGDAMKEMLREYRELDYRIGPEEARALAEHAGGHALAAQEIIGHPIHDRDHFAPWTAQDRVDDICRELQRPVTRLGIDHEYMVSLFKDLETTLQYAENLSSLENDLGGDAQHTMDRATLELLVWAHRKGEAERWAEGAQLGWSPVETQERVMEAHREHDEKIYQLYSRGPDPQEELPENVLLWAQKEGRLSGWIRDYHAVMSALEGGSQHDLPVWALTTRGQLRKQGTDQMKDDVSNRLQQLERNEPGDPAP